MTLNELLLLLLVLGASSTVLALFALALKGCGV